MVSSACFYFCVMPFDSIMAYFKLIDKILSNTVASDNILSYVCISDLGNGSRIEKH